MAKAHCRQAITQVIWIISNWKQIAFAVVLAGAFLGGWTVNGLRWEAKLADAEHRAEEARITLAQEAADLIEEASNVEAEIRTVYRDRIKTVYRYRGDARCIDEPGLRFIEQWNQIAGQTSQPDAAVPDPGQPATE